MAPPLKVGPPSTAPLTSPGSLPAGTAVRDDERLAGIHGKYDQTDGPEGAHYVPASPFRGLNCAACAFYEGPAVAKLSMETSTPQASVSGGSSPLT